MIGTTKTIEIDGNEKHSHSSWWHPVRVHGDKGANHERYQLVGVAAEGQCAVHYHHAVEDVVGDDGDYDGNVHGADATEEVGHDGDDGNGVVVEEQDVQHGADWETTVQWKRQIAGH